LATCAYCSVSPEDAWITTEFVVAQPRPGSSAACHVIVAPRRHVAAFYDLDVQEQRMIWHALAELRERITGSLQVEGFDAGFVDAPRGDDGSFHCYVHLIPRIAGESAIRPDGADWVDLGSQ
jgi:diadenosine tetraphosphate (Ap4A) HIT family hydrolase